jgi:DNA-directed RNA polymerase subunit M/transcription elongation factor TFIIS
LAKHLICANCHTMLVVDDGKGAGDLIECGNCHAAKPLSAFYQVVLPTQELAPEQELALKQRGEQQPLLPKPQAQGGFSGPTAPAPPIGEANGDSAPAPVPLNPLAQQIPLPGPSRVQPPKPQPPKAPEPKPQAPKPQAIEQLLCPSCGGTVTIYDNMSLAEAITCPKCGFSEKDTRFLDAPRKKLVCPKCLKQMEVFMDKTGSLRCQHCKLVRDVNSYLPPRSADHGGTALGAGMAAPVRLTRPATLTVVEGDCRGQSIVLLKGENTIGRKGAGSTCSVQLETRDTYMSQNHICVELVVRPDRTYEYRLSDLGSRNAALLNEMRLGGDEVLPLRPNDLIRIGSTVLRFGHLRTTPP